MPDQQETALDVVDSSGQVWPVTAEDYQPTDAQLTLIFDEPLPAGQYSLIVPASGGLTDLAGRAGRRCGRTRGRAGELDRRERHRAEVSRRPGRPLALDRPTWSGPPPMAPSPKRPRSPPGRRSTYRWVVIVPGIYKLQTQVDGSSIEVVNSLRRRCDRSRRRKHEWLEQLLDDLVRRGLRVEIHQRRVAAGRGSVALENREPGLGEDHRQRRKPVVRAQLDDVCSRTLASPGTARHGSSLDPAVRGWGCLRQFRRPGPLQLARDSEYRPWPDSRRGMDRRSGAGLVAESGAVAAGRRPTGQALAAGYSLVVRVRERTGQRRPGHDRTAGDRIPLPTAGRSARPRKRSSHAATPTPRAHGPTFARWPRPSGWFASARSFKTGSPPSGPTPEPARRGRVARPDFPGRELSPVGS